MRHLPPNPEFKGRKIRFAVVGCGRISKNHFNAIAKLSESCELVGVCDTNRQVLEATATELGVRGYQRIEDLLKAKNFDIVVLCTPSGIHAEQAIMVANSGFHVLTEKPMATRWTDGKKMVAACDQNEVHLFVVKQNRMNPTLRLLKKTIEEKRFGKIYLVTSNVFWTRPQEYYDSAKWRGTWELDGGAFMNQASHYVDLLEWLIGPIKTVHSFTSTLGRNIQVEDTGVLGIEWRSGALGSMNVTMLTYPKNLEGSITIIGEKGTVKLGGVAVNKIQHWEFSDKRPEDETVFNSNYETSSVYGNGHLAYYQNVVQTLRGEIDPETDGREGLKSLEVLIAIYLSSRDGKRVSLPLDLR